MSSQTVLTGVAAFGRVLVFGGLFVLGFVAYLLWGTGLYEARQQSRLEDSFRSQVEAQARVDGNESPSATDTTPPPPPQGDAVGIIKIPRIGMERVVVEGVGLGDLRKGPGHYPDTPLPGELGNSAIAGHRTTYGAPFNRLDELQTGDRILVTTLRSTFTYRVTETKIVKPSAFEVLNSTPDARLTLTTCEPKYSARQRLVVVATLDTTAKGSQEATKPPVRPQHPVRNGSAPQIDSAGLSGEHGSRLLTAAWAFAVATIGLGWWVAFRRWGSRHGLGEERGYPWRRRLLRFAGVVPFTVTLFIFYSHLERLLPSNF